jgi:hypothetical protein
MMKPIEGTTEIDSEPLAQFAIFMAKEIGDIEFFTPEQIDEDAVWEGISVDNAEFVESHGDDVVVHGSFTAPERVGRIPAGPNRGYGPINPPEVITEDVSLIFTIQFEFEDEGYASGTVEVM